MNNWRILVVEDDPDGQEVVGRILKHHHIPIDVVSNAEDALTMISQIGYTGIVTDLSLPGMDGWSLLHYLQNDPSTSGIPCVAITAYHSADLAVKAIADGFAAYFPKPLDSTGFVRELQRVFG